MVLLKTYFMNASNLWSLRLGFTSKQAEVIEKLGISNFLKQSFQSNFETNLPDFLIDDPKTLAELKEFRDKIKNADSDTQKKALKKGIRQAIELKKWWIEKMQNDAFPLREKMVCFWHNHFVATSQKVKVNYWIYQHNMILRENAFGNFKELTKKIVKTNAIVKYLDNTDNKVGKINENLSRELLELFTLGFGNYTENDIKQGAKGLAGLNIGNESAIYRPRLQDDDEITYFGKKGNFKIDEMIDIIFEQKAIPYLITRKILKWFIYDSPKEELVTYYGDYFKKMNFEIQPLLTKIFTEEFSKNNAGSKIKDPLVYILQLTNELQMKEIQSGVVAYFLNQQGMDLFNQVNVKGWDGGNSWLTSQNYLQRNNTADLFCSGKALRRKALKTQDEMQLEMNPEMQPEMELKSIQVKVNWDKKSSSNKQIITELSNRLLFKADENTQKDMEDVIKYDFNPNEENADFAVLRLFNYISKTPEYQLI